MREREDYLTKIKRAFRTNPIVAILGPRQCGKTTLAKMFLDHYQKNSPVTHFDLENPLHLAQLESPLLAMENLKGYIVIDEIQRRPDLFPVLRVLADQKKRRKFLILGSASRDLIKQSSETLAGRIQYVELTPFTYEEVDDFPRLWLRGGFPRSYLAVSHAQSYEWRKSYIRTFLERDIPNLGIHIPPKTLQRFWMMLAHSHGHIFNSSDIGRSLGVAHTTARHYLDILTGTFMIRELSPWFENINKRQVKSPKIYFRDSGIFHSLLGIETREALLFHPKLGASWEGTALEEIIRHHNATPSEAYFWGIHEQAELDLLIVKNGKKLGYEIKFTDAPKLTPSMKAAQALLQLDSLSVIYPGKGRFPLGNGIEAMGLETALGP